MILFVESVNNVEAPLHHSIHCDIDVMSCTLSLLSERHHKFDFAIAIVNKMKIYCFKEKMCNI